MNKRVWLFILIFVGSLNTCKSIGCSGNKTEFPVQADEFSKKRLDMVEHQIKRRGIHDSLVLKAMEKVPRHLFVPENAIPHAYGDYPLAIGNDQTISQPYIVAFMTACLALKGGEKVLEIGTGSGYQAAVLAEIVKEVYSIEIIEPLATRAEKILKKLNYENIYQKTGDGYFGWPEKSPFDAIIVTAAPPKIPRPLIDQLKTDGRMIIPVGDFSQELILITKLKNGEIKKKKVLPVRFVPMTGEIQK